MILAECVDVDAYATGSTKCKGIHQNEWIVNCKKNTLKHNCTVQYEASTIRDTHVQFVYMPKMVDRYTMPGPDTAIFVQCDLFLP